MGWPDLPASVRGRVEQIIGGPVVEARSQAGGFSPGTADRVRTADGRRAFVKAVTPAVNERSAALARQEILITAAMPESAPVPRSLGGFDDGDWVVLILEDIEGVEPRTPWVESEIDAAVAALGELAAALTPAPAVKVPRVTELLAEDFTGWDRIAADPPADLEPWLAARLEDLSAAAARGLTALEAGDTLTHGDIRSDNMLVRPDGRIMIVDWPWGAVGPAWLDRMLLAVNVAVHGGDADRIVADLDQRLVTDVLTGLAGMFRDGYRQPPPPGVPTLRAFMKFQCEGMLRWLRARQSETR
jgi:aminoglycoside phosphotransferase (APT) family kinase protein